MEDYAKTLDGVNLQVEDAQNDVGKQLNQIQNFVASGVDAIIVNPVDTDATQAMIATRRRRRTSRWSTSTASRSTSTPCPTTRPSSPRTSGSRGTLEAKEVCRLLKEKGKGEGANIIVLMGQLSNQAAQQRTADVARRDRHRRLQVHEDRRGADRQLVPHRGQRPDDQLAVGRAPSSTRVVSNNDEMAIGAIQAMKAAGMSTDSVIVGGVDATQDALAAMAGGRPRRHGVPGRGRARARARSTRR